MLGKVSYRRGANVVRLGKRLFRGAVDEFGDAAKAIKEGRLADHLRTRQQVLAKNVRDGVDSTRSQLRLIQKALKENPGDTVPKLMVTVLAALAASGGVDGDGGVPDLDIQLMGIGAHRSPLTHSFFAGVVIETLLYAMAHGIGTFYPHLPTNHDPIWDAIARNKDEYLMRASQGASVGIAYHLFIDATVQPAPYHGLPFSMPMDGHQTLLATNGGVEALDVAVKDKTFGKQRKDSASGN